MKKGTIWMSLGILLILAAFSLAIYNIYQEREAQQESSVILEQLVNEIDINEQQPDDMENVLTLEMLSISIAGNQYVAVLQLPTLGLELPVMESWSYPKLRLAPCRYRGSVHTKDLIIAAHNYSSHFGQIKTLVIGDEVVLWDVNGNSYVYEVVELEELGGTAVEEMEAGDWDLTLFTCTYGGRSRVTVRCKMI